MVKRRVVAFLLPGLPLLLLEDEKAAMLAVFVCLGIGCASCVCCTLSGSETNMADLGVVGHSLTNASSSCSISANRKSDAINRPLTAPRHPSLINTVHWQDVGALVITLLVCFVSRRGQWKRHGAKRGWRNSFSSCCRQ